MKRFTALFLNISLLLTLVIPCYAATTNPIQAGAEHELHVEYMEFYNNQQYYTDLATKQGYTVVVNVGEEYIDLERERIASRCVSAQERMNSIQPYGNSVPTETWNCTLYNECPLNGHNYQSTIYSNYKVYGSLAYVVSVTNLYDQISMTYIPHGSTSSVTSVTIPPLSTVIQGFGTASTRDYFYLSFPPPAYFTGYINSIAE